jgi:peptidoglycan/xylan/chitin deacetylase (PgdA/CDA1 family)
MFERQMAYLKSNFNIISLGHYVFARRSGHDIRSPSVIVTFDDGYKDFLTDAYPILVKYGIPATLFVTSEYVGGNLLYWWDEISSYIKQNKAKFLNLDEIGKFELLSLNSKMRAIEVIADKLTHLDEGKRRQAVSDICRKLDTKKSTDFKSQHYVTWEDLREIDRTNFEIGAHSRSHPNLRRLSDRKLVEEIVESKNDIEKEIKRPVDLFAYPYGHPEHFDKRVIKAVKDAGFLCACTTITGITRENDDLYKLKRIPLFHYNNWNAFKVKLSGLVN